MEQNKEPLPKGRISAEEYRRLVQGVDDIYFGGAEDVESEDHIGRYTQMKAHQWGVTLAEAAERSMSRLYGQIQVSERVVIVTAFQHKQSLRQNRGLNVSLASDIRQLGWGYTPVMGGFVEKNKDGKDVHVREESFFVNADSSPKQVSTAVLKMLETYQQQAALVKLSEQPDAMLLWANGSTTSVGQWHADSQQMAQYYTRMRNGPPGRQFTFEAAGDDSGMTRLGVDLFFKNR